MAVVNIMFGGYDLSDELNETTSSMNDAVAKEKARAEAAEKAINDELDGLADLLDSI
jgi:hypothetical protein